MRTIAALALALLCAGCVTTEVVHFQPRPQQEAIIRDGRPALVSRKANSIVLIRPAGRQINANGRPVFVIGIYNLTNRPQNFLVANIDVTQTVNQAAVPIHVITYEQLANEEKTRQVMQAMLVGVAAGANAYSAANAGRYNSNSTVYTPHGIYNVQTAGYSPAAAAIAQSNARAQNDAMISAAVERGQQNMTVLEAGVIKDNTLMPGEWYGGQLHLSPPASSSNSAKTYTIALTVGTDRHEIEVVQQPSQ